MLLFHAAEEEAETAKVAARDTHMGGRWINPCDPSQCCESFPTEDPEG